MDFLERLSTLLGKKYLFIQDNGLYYNKYNCKYLTKEEAEDFIMEMLLEEI